MNGVPRSVAVVTGSPADYGLLRPVIRAIDARDDLTRRLWVTGTHLLPPAETVQLVKRDFDVEACVEMHEPGAVGRAADARALGRGVIAFAALLAANPPAFVLVLGDRVEALAAATAAAVGGVRVAHMHGGDRAEGIADDSIRHAISKLAHLHLAASSASVERLLYLGEEPRCVRLVGSPAIDGLDEVPPLDEKAYKALDSPRFVLLLHPAGGAAEDEWANAERALRLCRSAGETLVLDPNHDPGREAIMEAIEQSGCRHLPHLPRAELLGLLRRVAALVGNSSTGIIECAGLGVRAINLGPRQAGRERPYQVVDIPDWDFGALDMALEHALADPPLVPGRHPFGPGLAGPRTAEILATIDLERCPLKKLCSY